MDKNEWIRLNTQEDIMETAMSLKHQVWAYIDRHKINRSGLKTAINEVIELVEELSPEYD